jgi:hypothetical protein
LLFNASVPEDVIDAQLRLLKRHTLNSPNAT